MCLSFCEYLSCSTDSVPKTLTVRLRLNVSSATWLACAATSYIYVDKYDLGLHYWVDIHPYMRCVGGTRACARLDALLANAPYALVAHQRTTMMPPVAIARLGLNHTRYLNSARNQT